MLPSVSEAPDDLPTYENTLTRSETLREHLLWQLHLSNFSDGEIAVGEDIIGNLNDDGYLQDTVEEIVSKTGHTTEVVERVLRKIHEFDPVGIASRDIKECLILQARHLGEEAGLIVKVIDEHLGDLERHNYQHIVRKQNLTMEKVKEIAHVIGNM